MHSELFGTGHGLVEEVGRRLRDCFADARLKEQGLPHALLYWPITAGGLALAHPLMHVAAYLRGHAGWEEPPVPDEEIVAAYLWKREEDVRKHALTGGELNFLPTLDPSLPNMHLSRAQIEEFRKPEMASMEALVQDFIARGSEVSGRGQATLSPYWRWVVYAYGPSLLQSLGTFRFLLTELVPLQLILENRGLTSGSVDAGGGRDPVPPPDDAGDGPDDELIPF
jgi:hypothetical protein